MRKDEKRFLKEVFEKCGKIIGKEYISRVQFLYTSSPRDVINQDNFYMHHKRAWYILDKWSGKGWYDYGVSLDMGWLTDTGKEIAKNLIT